MEITRKLATIQTVKEVHPIEGADRIVLVSFVNNNWKCIMKKEEASEDLKVVYFEVDSVLPKDDERFAFMEPRNFRVKTAKMRGVVSQGLAMPVILFPELTIGDLDVDGTNLTKKLNIEKYEPPVSTSTGGDVKGAFPGFIQKTDEERIQNYTDDQVASMLSKPLTATIKVDGTSGTFYYFDGQFGVCSRNLELKDTEKNVHWIMARKYGIKEKMEALGKNLAIQGEVAGPGVQKNRAHYEEVGLHVFTAQDLDTNRRLLPGELDDLIIALNETGVEGFRPLMPVHTIGEYEANHFENYDDLIDFVQSETVNPEFTREGVVFRGTEDEHLSFKVINPKYLLKHSL